MRNITDYNELSPLLSAQLRPGVVTNAVQKKEEYLFAIAHGALYVQEFPGGLYLLWRRESHWQLYFYRQRDAVLPLLEPMDMPVVLEVASVPGMQPSGPWSLCGRNWDSGGSLTVCG